MTTATCRQGHRRLLAWNLVEKRLGCCWPIVRHGTLKSSCRRSQSSTDRTIALKPWSIPIRRCGASQHSRPLGPEHPPLTVATRVEVGTPLVTIGNGAGLPTKISSNATVDEVLEGRPYLRAETDSFSGGSGSAALGENLELVAIQSRGQSDWAWDEEDNCFDTTTVSTGFESHQLAKFAVDRLCEVAPCAAKGLRFWARESRTANAAACALGNHDPGLPNAPRSPLPKRSRTPGPCHSTVRWRRRASIPTSISTIRGRR